MKKSFYALFLMVLCAICLTGCAKNAANKNQIFEKNAFRIVRQADASGQIGLSYIFPVNEKLLKEKGFTNSDVQTYRFYLSTYVNALAVQNREKATEGTTVSGCTYFEDVDGLGFSLVFENIDAQKKFFGVEDDTNEDEKSQTQSSGFFIKKFEMKTVFPISSQKFAGDLKLICTMAVSSWCKDNNISVQKKAEALQILEDAIFIYDFATLQKSLKSDTMYDDENFHHNVFFKTYDQLDENNQISFYVLHPNVPIWYASALVTVIATMIVSYVVLKNKKAKNK